MARETKVGLLAGLAFIICFAVILANRGVNGPPGLTNSFLPDGGLELAKLVQRNQPPNGAPSPIAPRNRPLTRQVQQDPPTNHPADGVYRSQGAQPAPNDFVPSTGSQLPLESMVEAAPPSHESALAQNPRPVDIANPNGANAEGERALNYPVPMTATIPVPSDSMATSGRLAQYEPSEASPSTAQPTTVVHGTPYTVKPSDTLSSIALAHYGTRSKQAVETIFDANRNVLTDINYVRTGMVLLIPNRDGELTRKGQSLVPVSHTSEKVAAANGRETGTSVEKVRARRSDASKTGNIKWYQVKKDDRYASIAREQLGDASRWQEIHELNKDKFPDPNHIREGVRIKLPPPMTLAIAGEEKRR